MKPSVSFSQEARSTDDFCPSVSVALTTQRQRPSGSPCSVRNQRPRTFLAPWVVFPPFFLIALGHWKLVTPGSRVPVSVKAVTPPGPTRLAVTFEVRTTLYESCCRSAIPWPL